ncbi:hypothetical protein [Streptomyces sp. NPDC005046]
MANPRRRLRVRSVTPRPPLRRRAPRRRSTGLLGFITRPFSGIRGWYQVADLGKHTAVLAAVVAAASLAISAWGTWKSAQVADDQLAQSSQQRDEETRLQASRITVWAEKNTLVISNRSPDAAGGWANVVYLEQDPGHGVTKDWIGMLPPCKRIEIPMSEFDARPYDKDGDGNVRHRVVTGLTIRDATGHMWVRLSRGTLSRLGSAVVEDRGVFVSTIGSILSAPHVRIVDLQDCNP